MGDVKHYSLLEEKTNIISHAFGLALSIVALVLLMARANLYGNVLQLVSVSIFGASLIALYLSSTVYHSAKEPEFRSRMRIIDHATIYILIAGTYTPFAGGVAYTIGAIIYSIKKITFNHAIFHLFVLLGSSCHFVSVYFYVLLNE
jgi:hemolysin III